MYYRHGPRLFWPIILIGAGIVFLLTNLNVIQGNPWAVLWRLWPVLLIALGAEILLGRSGSLGAFISALLGLAVVGFVLWVLIARPALPGFNLGFGGDLQTQPIEYPLKDIRSASVSIGFTTGTNELRASTDSDKLIEGTIRHYGTLRFDASDSGSQAYIRLSSEGVSVPFGFGSDSSERWDISLNPRVAYDLDLSMGVGQSDIDLSKLTISGGRLNAGVGTTDVRLPVTGRFALSVDGGVGTLRIHLPSAMALRVEVDTGIGSFSPGSRLQPIGGDVYQTDGFTTADNAITLRVKVGVGSVSVIDGE
jgi:hypothetical protein